MPGSQVGIVSLPMVNMVFFFTIQNNISVDQIDTLSVKSNMLTEMASKSNLTTKIKENGSA